MEQAIMSKLFSITTLIIWLAVLLVYVLLEKKKTEVLSVRAVEDMDRFQCATVKNSMNVISKIHKLFIITLIIISLYLVISSILKTLLFLSGDTISASHFGHILWRIINPISILVCLSGLGAYTTTKLTLRYYTAVEKRCKELGVIIE